MSGVFFCLAPVIIFLVTPRLVVKMAIATGEVAGTLSPDIGTVSMAPLPYLASNNVS